MKRQRVIKVGGSLLDLPDLRKRILDWIEKAEAFKLHAMLPDFIPIYYSHETKLYFISLRSRR